MNENTTPQDGTTLQPGIGISTMQLKPILGETLESFEAFVCYFNLGKDRSLRQVAQKMDLNISTIKEWSAKHRWVNRIFEYSASLFQNCVETQTEGVRQQALLKTEREKLQLERCSSLSTLCLNLGENIIKHILLTAPDRIKPGDAIRLMDLGDRLGRSARAGVDVEDLQDADQAALKSGLMDAINWVAEQRKSTTETPGTSAPVNPSVDPQK